MQNPNHSKSVGDDDDGNELSEDTAWQAFMLGGGANRGAAGKKKKKGRHNTHNRGSSVGGPTGNGPSPTSPNKNAAVRASPASTTTQTSLEWKSHQNSSHRQKVRKKYWQILSAFRKTLQEDWLDVDDHLGDVIHSIVDLRSRILMSSKCLHTYCDKTRSSAASSSLGRGYRNQPQDSNLVTGYLVEDDVELALSHGLMQHEKMMTGARRLISSLHQAQEALGRRLDELMTFRLDANEILRTPSSYSQMDQNDDAVEDGDLALFGMQLVEWARQVFTELAEELYWKQCLVQTMLDSVNDDLLYHDGIMDGESTPLKVAQRVRREWPRGGVDESERSRVNSILAGTPWEEKFVGEE